MNKTLIVFTLVSMLFLSGCSAQQRKMFNDMNASLTQFAEQVDEDIAALRTGQTVVEHQVADTLEEGISKFDEKVAPVLNTFGEAVVEAESQEDLIYNLIIAGLGVSGFGGAGAVIQNLRRRRKDLEAEREDVVTTLRRGSTQVDEGTLARLPKDVAAAILDKPKT